MSDSVDRVFSHALNTVNKIRTGSEKPPPAVRLKLYGLYKQSMEGDVDGIMARPQGDSEETQRAREKWDAWKQQNGLSRTEAKRRYITTLIETMQKYASWSPDARELVAELEFVWDQVKSNVPSSSSSSPLQAVGTLQNLKSPSFQSIGLSHDPRQFRHTNAEPPAEDAPMRVLSPLSQSEEEELEDNAEEFVDAQDSQHDGLHASDDPNNARRDSLGGRQHGPTPQDHSSSDQRWRKRVEQALVKMTAEVAALREQLESRRLFGRRRSFAAWILRACWFIVKHIAVDAIILGTILLWMRRKRDRRFEGAIRVLLGDAVAQVQKVGAAQMASIGKISIPKPSARPT